MAHFDMMMKRIITYMLLIIASYSCKNPTDKTLTSDNSYDTTNTNKSPSSTKELSISIFKTQIDSLLKKTKGDKYFFQLNIDTFYCQNTDINTMKFKVGLFHDLCSDSIERIICNYFFVPNSQEMFRIYLIDATFYNETSLYNKINELKVSMKDSMPGGFDCDYFVKIGLTPCHDYIMTSNNRLYWLNIYYPYSRNDFFQFIKCLRNNVDTTVYQGQILCFFGGECTDQNVP